jgi:hypothetical protein
LYRITQFLLDLPEPEVEVSLLSLDEFENDYVKKPRLLRVDHKSPIVKLYDFCSEKYYRTHHEGTKEIHI